MKINAPISLNEREKKTLAQITARIPRIKVVFGEKPEPEPEIFTADELAEYGPAAERRGFLRKWLRG